MCTTYNVARNICRWRMVIFFSFLNTAGINSEIIYLWNKKTTKSRRFYLKALVNKLCLEQLEQWSIKTVEFQLASSTDYRNSILLQNMKIKLPRAISDRGRDASSVEIKRKFVIRNTIVKIVRMFASVWNMQTWFVKRVIAQRLPQELMKIVNNVFVWRLNNVFQNFNTYIYFCFCSLCLCCQIFMSIF